MTGRRYPGRALERRASERRGPGGHTPEGRVTRIGAPEEWDSEPARIRRMRLQLLIVLGYIAVAVILFFVSSAVFAAIWPTAR